MKKIIPTITIVLLTMVGCHRSQNHTTSTQDSLKAGNADTASFSYGELSLKEIMMMDSVEKRRFYLALTDSLPDIWNTGGDTPTTYTVEDTIPSLPMDEVIFLHYRQKVGGYGVKIIFKRAYDDLDFGRAVLYFSKPGHTFFVYCDAFSDLGLTTDVLDKVKVGETIYLDYIHPKKGEYLSDDSPFYFKDMDFDGDEELVVNNLRLGSRGYNIYDVFKVFGVERPLRLIGLPFVGTCKITNYNVEYEPKSRCVLNKRYDGFDAYGHYRYKSVPSNDENGLKRVFVLVDAEDMGFYHLKDEKASDSINLLQPYKKYERVKGILVLTERGIYETGNYGRNYKEIILEKDDNGLSMAPADSLKGDNGIERIIQTVLLLSLPCGYLWSALTQ